MRAPNDLWDNQGETTNLARLLASSPEAVEVLGKALVGPLTNVLQANGAFSQFPARPTQPLGYGPSCYGSQFPTLFSEQQMPSPPPPGGYVMGCGFGAPRTCCRLILPGLTVAQNQP